MTHALTHGQRALLEAALKQHELSLEQGLALQLGGAGRVEHAREQLQDEVQGDRGHESDREVDLARSDASLQSLREVRQALSRVHDDDYGVCEDCGAGIPFDRLRLNPQATRCVACQDTFERQHGGLTHATL